MLKFTAKLHTPNDDTDDDVIYSVELPGKRELRQIERELTKVVNHLGDLVDRELETGVKAAPKGSDPRLLRFDVDIEDGDGNDWGGYGFRWPNQSAEARAYVRGLLDAAMATAGQKKARQTKPKNWHRSRRG